MMWEKETNENDITNAITTKICLVFFSKILMVVKVIIKEREGIFKC